MAALTPNQPAAPAAPASPQMDPADIARLLQAHLKRVGCNPSNTEGKWDDGSRKALELFNKNAKTKFEVKLASLDALDAVRGKTDRVCPLVCDAGYVLNSSGACEKKPEAAPKPRTVTREAPRARRAVAPQRRRWRPVLRVQRQNLLRIRRYRARAARSERLAGGAHDPRLVASGGAAAAGEDILRLARLQHVPDIDDAVLAGHLQIGDHLVVRIVAVGAQRASAGDTKRCRAARRCGGLAELGSIGVFSGHAAVDIQPRRSVGLENAGALDVKRKVLDGGLCAGRNRVNGELGAGLRKARFGNARPATAKTEVQSQRVR